MKTLRLPPPPHREHHRIRPVSSRGYTLIEALVASGVLLVGVSAAAAMSLALVTQEEINENTLRAANHLDNAARLMQLGLAPATVVSLLPEVAVVDSLDFSQRDLSVPGIGTIPAITVSVTYRPTGATAANRGNVLEWTGGDPGTRRTASVEIISDAGVRSGTPPRVSHFK